MERKTELLIFASYVKDRSAVRNGRDFFGRDMVRFAFHLTQIIINFFTFIYMRMKET